MCDEASIATEGLLKLEAKLMGMELCNNRI